MSPSLSHVTEPNSAHAETMISLRFIRLLVMADPNLRGLADLVVNGTTLIAVGGPDHALVTWAVDETQTVQFRDKIDVTHDSGTFGAVSGAILQTQFGTGFLPLGRYDDPPVLHWLTTNGEFTSKRNLYALNISHTTVAQTVASGNKVFLFTAQDGYDGFHLFRLRDDLSLEYRRSFADTPETQGREIIDMASATINGRAFVFTVSGTENGISSYWVGQWGNTRFRSSISADDVLWVSAPTDLETLTVGGRTYLILGAQGSSSITSIWVNSWGGMFVRAHQIDDLTTRFAHLSALATTQIDGRGYVIAGGTDGGITVFELSPDGQLHHTTTLVDTVSLNLGSITDIEVVKTGPLVSVFVIAKGQDGIVQFDLTFGNLGAQVIGTHGADDLIGTDADDQMSGYGGNDTLRGLAGDDRIIDGTGADHLYGGSGSDTFVFRRDNQLDRVYDFEPGFDKLDMTEFVMLHGISQLEFLQRDYGVLITYGLDRFAIQSNEAQLTIDQLGPDDFIFA